MLLEKKIELLAPAGNMESLKAAVAGGCNAVYMGLTVFSARAFAGNFTHEEFIEAVAYCHKRDVCVYVTINTMLFETEMENAKEEVKFLYEHDVDGILVQDLGLFHYIRSCYPDLDVHCSTQMHIHNLNGVKEMQKEGATRVVLARETPIEIVREAVKTGVEIEVFVYGAICISYSGQCLFSASVKHRSANRGMCAQCCRLQYYPEDEESAPKGDYLLSPRDLNVIDEVPQLIEAGVASLKIEGRMKRPEYVYLVTKTFREAIDAYYAGKPYKVSKERTRELQLMFNRGFSKGHLFHDDVENRMSYARPNHRGVKIGTVVSASRGRVTVRLTDTLTQHDGLRILAEPADIGLQATKIEKNGKLVNRAEKGDTVVLTCPDHARPKPGQPLQRTTATDLIEEIQKEIRESERRSPVRVTVSALADSPLLVSVEDSRGNVACASSEALCQKPLKAPVSKQRIEEVMRKTGEMPLEVMNVDIDTDGIFLPISVINETRRQAFEDLLTQRAVTHERKGFMPYACDLKPSQLPDYRLLVQDDGNHRVNMDKVRYVSDHDIMPVVHENCNDSTEVTDTVLSSVGDCYNSVTGNIAGMTCNIANSYAGAWYLLHGCSAVVLSSEVTDVQLKNLIEAFEERYGFTPPVYKPVYGKRTLMYIKDCFTKCNSDMTDMHGNFYQVRKENGITSVMEPDVYTDTNPYAYGSYLIFTPDTENRQEILEEAYEEISERI